jgi:type IV secretory pathway TraG/TraD family ATPase VirD4
VGFDAEHPLAGAFAGSAEIASVITDPFAIDIGNSAVRLAALIGALVPLSFVFLLGMTSRFKGRLESGMEHGDARFATVRETGALIDRRRFANNLFFSAHSGISLAARTRTLARAQKGRNTNVICMGISGLGKSFSVVLIDILAACAGILKGTKKGPLGALGNIKDSIVFMATGARPPVRYTPDVIDEGFDLYVSDPKGDLLRDCGHMLEAAGFGIACLNTLDLNASARYNPLSYIRCREVDVADADECRFTLTADAGETVTPGGTEGIGAGEEISAQGGFGRLDVSCSVTALSAKAEEGTLADGVEVPGASAAVGSVLSGFSYRRSVLELRVAYRNTDHRDHDPHITVFLPGPCELDEMAYTGTAQYDADTHSVTWRAGSIPGRAKGTDAGDVSVHTLVLKAPIKAMRVPDGMDLAKTVNCLTANLANTDTPPGGDQQFWEDCKTLAFMSYISFLFERYEARYRTLPEVLRLLNMTMCADGEGISDLDVLMEAWETGKVKLPEKSGERTLRSGVSRSTLKEVDAGCGAHPRERSYAVHCYHAFKSGAPETVQSVVATCHAALVRIVSDEVRRLLSADEMALDALGTPGLRKAVFLTFDAKDDTYKFLTSLLTYQSLSLCMDKAYREGGSLARHVRFVLDETPQLGRLPMLERQAAVVRSMNISLALFCQSASQLAKVYGKEDASTLMNCCTNFLFLGAQDEETLSMVSKVMGTATVYGKTTSATFGQNYLGAQSTSDSIQATGRPLMSEAQIRQLTVKKMLVFIYGLPPILDAKYPTQQHPLFPYVASARPEDRRPWVARRRFADRFDFAAYLKGRRKK